MPQFRLTRPTPSARLALAATLAIVLTGSLVSASPGTARTMTDPTIGQNSPAYQDFYTQGLEWNDCPGSGLQCASVEVPMDWSRPDGPRIVVTFAMVPASDTKHRIGSLLINPGGPGASAIDSLEYLASTMPSKVRARYDIVGVDPRGVGQSVPVTCMNDEDMGEFLEFFPEPPGTKAIIETHRVMRAYARECREHTGEVLGYVDSLSSARDMDVIRAVLGDETLTYVGYSYGTFLGSLYAQEYGDRAGRLILDGAVDPTLPTEKESTLQMASFDRAMSSYVETCMTQSACPLSGRVTDAMEQIKAFIDARSNDPLPTSNEARKLTKVQAATGVLTAMYSQDLWVVLTHGLAAAMNDGDGSILLALADSYYQRDNDTGAFESNMMDAFAAISCLDKPVDARRVALDAAEAEATDMAPLFGEFARYGSINCAVWPYPARLAPEEITAPYAPPIVVVGTTGDPATPYENAVNLARSLARGVLVTYEGEGHTAVGGGVRCIDNAIEAFLVDGIVPEDGLTCTD